MIVLSRSAVIRSLAGSLIWLLVASSAQSLERQDLNKRADVAAKQAKNTERDQLKKAQKAVNDTQAREKKMLKKSPASSWESEQVEKAQQQFNERSEREQKYLKEAKEAAAKERKIPKP